MKNPHPSIWFRLPGLNLVSVGFGLRLTVFLVPAAMLHLSGAAAIPTAVSATLPENEFLQVTRERAERLAAPTTRVIIALSSFSLLQGKNTRVLERGDMVVLAVGEKAEARGRPEYYCVAIRPQHPPGKAPSEVHPPEKNKILFEAADFYVYEETLAMGDTRAAHTHNTRLTVVINPTALRGDNEQIFPQVADAVKFIPQAANHGRITNVGPQPLRNVVVEFKAN